MRTVRSILGVAGVGLAAVGLWKLLGQDGADLRDALLWLVGGAVVHDAMLAPVVVLVGAVVIRALPVWARMPVVAGFVVLGSATLMALPVLGRFGAREDNPTLLDRDYVGGWLVLALLTTLGVAVGSWWQRRQSASRGDEDNPGGDRAHDVPAADGNGFRAARAAAEGQSGT